MKILVFTDLDATLLDPHTYTWTPARPAVETLRKHKAGVVLVSSKTFAEMVPLRQQLGLDDPFVVENGGGIVIHEKSQEAAYFRAQGFRLRPVGSEGLVQLSLGPNYELLTHALSEISAEAKCQTCGFASLSSAEIMEMTGLSLEEASKARQRSFDEPFIIINGSDNCEPLIYEAAARRGLSVVKGGRFLHLIGHEGKGRAVSRLIDAYCELYGEVRTIGLGDSPNDFPFLRLVDIPVLLGVSFNNAPAWPHRTKVRKYPAAGPHAWNAAIFDALAEIDS